MAARLKHHYRFSLSVLFFLVFASVVVVNASQVMAAPTATLSLTPATISTSVGQKFTVNVELNTGNTPSDGARVILNYNKDLLTATKITPGTIFKEYPTNAQSIDTATGVVRVSGIAETGQTYNGTGTFASVEFTAKAPGSANISFDFVKQGETTDSNVASTDATSGVAVDILAQTTGATVTVAQDTIGGGGGATTEPRDTLPDTASISPTIVLSSIGSGLVLLGLALFFAF